MRGLRACSLAVLAVTGLEGCIAYTVVDTAVDVTTTAVGAAADVTGAAVGGAVDLVTEDEEEASAED